MIRLNTYMIERPGYNPEQEQLQERKGSPKRLMLAIETLVKTTSRNVEVQGREHLAEIPKDRKVIVVTSHISDIDIPLSVKALGYDLDIVIVNESPHHSFRQEWNTYLGLVAAGKKNFIPLDFRKNEKGEKEPLSFNPDNFKPMEEVMDQGKAVLMAAHNPSHNWRLEEGGYGPAYLAELTDAVILPVGVNVKSEKPMGMYENQMATMKSKPDASVTIGEPFELTKIEGSEDLASIIGKMHAGERLTREQINRLTELRKKLKEQSDKIMQRVADLVPEEKRGIYKKEEPL